LTEYVLRTGKPLLASPEVFDELEKKGEIESVGPQSIDWLGVPLKTKGRTIGVLTVQSYTEGLRYSEEDKNILTFISDQVAMAIERKGAEEELKEAYEELKASQLKLIQSEKLAAVGELAAGVAHEINNPLFAIKGEAEMLLMDEDIDGDTKEAAGIIVEQSERIKEVNERLLEFSHKRELNREPLDVDNILEKSISLLRYQTKIENLEIRKELEPNLPKILGDSNQLQGAFLNIMLNAVQTMEERGKLTVRTYREKVTKHGRRKMDKFKLGTELVVIEFKDTGKGMDEEKLSKIFDPFFSTKEKGAGLGLSVCHRLIEDHNGIIEVHSKLGEGSIFIIKLPILEVGR